MRQTGVFPSSKDADDDDETGPPPNRRYERKAEHFLAFVGIASALICYLRCPN